MSALASATLIVSVLVAQVQVATDASRQNETRQIQSHVQGIVLTELEGTIVWRSIDYPTHPAFTLKTLANGSAPILWFSPDEPLLRARRAIPEEIPKLQTPPNYSTRVVYYNIPRLLIKNSSRCAPLLTSDSVRDENTEWIDTPVTSPPSVADGLDPKHPPLDCLDSVKIRYFFYYDSEVGTAAHSNDFESVQINIDIVSAPLLDERIRRISKMPAVNVFQCGDGVTSGHCAVVRGVFGSAHGIAWYTNGLNVQRNSDALLPLTVLVEEGKHASSPDRNADGTYTPGFDVDIHPNDAWGIRDILRTRWLQGPAFRADMAKHRLDRDMVFPSSPNPRLKARYQQTHLPSFGLSASNSGTAVEKWVPTYELRNIQAEDAGSDSDGRVTYCVKNSDHLSARVPARLGCGLTGSCEKLKTLFEDEEGCRQLRVLPRKGWILIREQLAKLNAGGTHDEYLTWPRFFRERVLPSARFSGSMATISWTPPIAWNVPGLDGWVTSRINFNRPLAPAPVKEGFADAVYSTSAARYMSVYAAIGRDTVLSDPRDPHSTRHTTALESGFKMRFPIPWLKIFSGVRVGARADDPSSFRYGRLIIEVGGGSW
jgi:hypothetical protein